MLTALLWVLTCNAAVPTARAEAPRLELVLSAKWPVTPASVKLHARR